MFIYLHFSKTIHRRSRRPFFVHLFFFFTLTLCQIVPNLALTRSARTPGILSPTPLMLIMQCLSRTMYRVLQSLPLESELYPLLCCDPSLKIMFSGTPWSAEQGLVPVVRGSWSKHCVVQKHGRIPTAWAAGPGMALVPAPSCTVTVTT